MQLIESRISTFQSALLLSSSLDFLYTGVSVLFSFHTLHGQIRVLQKPSSSSMRRILLSSFSQVLDEEVNENDAIVPIIYEEDDSDDKESGDEMETDDDDDERDEVEAFDDLSAGEVDDDMSG